jgi:hypothetical protein
MSLIRDSADGRLLEWGNPACIEYAQQVPDITIKKHERRPQAPLETLKPWFA